MLTITKLMNTLSNLGSWASIIALPITFWVLIETYRIKQHFSNRARLPEILKKLTQHSRTYLANIKPEKDINLAYKDAAIILGILQIFRSKTISKKVASLDEGITKIARITANNQPNANELWEAYTSITKIITSLEQIERDMAWS